MEIRGGQSHKDTWAACMTMTVLIWLAATSLAAGVEGFVPAALPALRSASSARVSGVSALHANVGDRPHSEKLAGFGYNIFFDPSSGAAAKPAAPAKAAGAAAKPAAAVVAMDTTSGHWQVLLASLTCSCRNCCCFLAILNRYA